MSTLIANGTIVTADLTYKADVLIEDGQIIALGHGLKGDEVLDATGCYVRPGGIDPHTHLELPGMGTYAAADFDSGTRAALAGGTTMVVDFALPSPGQGLLDALHAGGSQTSGELAMRAGKDERYVREWLGAMTVGGIVETDASSTAQLVAAS